jgi:hypothetical protein
MSLRRLLLVGLLCLVAAVGITLLVRDRDRGGGGLETTGAAVPLGPIAVQPTFSPRVARFGDTVTASIDVVLDRRRVQAGSARVRPQFAPWTVVAPPVRTRRDSQATSYIRTTYVLRCVISPCVPQRGTSSLEFDPVRVSYTTTRGKKRTTDPVRWPVLVIHSQIVSDDFDNPAAIASPWRADAVTLPAVSYRLLPSRLRVGALVVGALLTLAAIVLAVLAIPARGPKPEPEPEPEIVLPPLEHALVLLEAEVHANGAADRRRALELVAEEMEERGDLRLARRARGMAWSEDDPAVVETRGLAAQVRALIAEDEPPEEEEEEVGDAPPA